MKITVRKRADDWIAYLNDNLGRWESGKTSTEAIGKLIVSYCLELKIELEWQ